MRERKRESLRSEKEEERVRERGGGRKGKDIGRKTWGRESVGK